MSQFATLMQFLRQLRREGAAITEWLPEYESVNGKHTGRGWVTVTFQEKKPEP